MRVPTGHVFLVAALGSLAMAAPILKERTDISVDIIPIIEPIEKRIEIIEDIINPVKPIEKRIDIIEDIIPFIEPIEKRVDITEDIIIPHIRPIE
ncbi:hypothetical protein SLS64_003562 [Diaporthe eres]